jgi:hypothetical protein
MFLHAHLYSLAFRTTDAGVQRMWREKDESSMLFNPLTPNDTYSGRTAPLTSKRCILYIYSTNIGT